ncbi:MAG: SRPBCC domain-containing protein [Ignavibacteriaceae bacterium]|nr:SRPBCC domain-containing protein [Ignavibacteriaceae bacterium]
MAGPKGEEHWCRADFKSISANKSLNAVSAFCDQNGKITTDFPIATWHCEFSEASNKTTVNIEIKFESLADLEKYIEMGFKEGFTMALGNLDELLAAQKV